MPDKLKTFNKLESNWKKGLRETEFKFIEWIIKNERYDLFRSKQPRKNWIRETLLEKKCASKFKTCNTLVMVGSGMYPYSLVDLNKEYPNMKMIGIDFDEKCVKISQFLIKKSRIKNLDIIHMDGKDYDYSNLEHEDLVFFSIDVVGIDSVFQKVIETSKAQPFICAPGKHAWFKNSFGDYLKS